MKKNKEIQEKFIKWTEDNLEYILEKYKEVHPEEVKNNADMMEIVNWEEVFDWAYYNLY